jgi:hypothetical protein
VASGEEKSQPTKKSNTNQITVSDHCWAAAGTASRAISPAIIGDKRTFEKKRAESETGSLFFFFFLCFRATVEMHPMQKKKSKSTNLMTANYEFEYEF